MALFGRKKKTEEKVEETKEIKKVSKSSTKKTSKKDEGANKDVLAVKSQATKEGASTKEKSDYSYRITEKATRLSEGNVFVLNVPKDINKTQLKLDLEKKYKVTVLNINVVNSPKKAKTYKGRLGYRGGGKKAYITLKAGDSIVL
jgi:large subunit ribosomal protein L23